MRRGVFTRVPELGAAIDEFIRLNEAPRSKLRGILRNSPKSLPSFVKATGYSAKENNKSPKPFVWTRPVDDRLKKIPHGNAVIETPP
jgi:hypothetical protein